ncbi:hypothetical protein OG909_20965 [Streptomyces sp. NBC_01754]|uniref:hypothetical protein n=1 Tax=Streptomyces sp. NBC_01754 TaxID=2975930 RepID=UPI002DD951D7|nr:hypothetical protein [Streptomyces sp. NBC_01754]WSC94543.1 hypothetical protein OG909_20965 [Streptomyces sp. NBC_01754]
MIGFGKQVKQEAAVLVLRDVAEIAEMIRQELATAPDDRRPGLERALELVAEAAAVPDAELRGRWVRQRLAATGYRGPVDSVAAIKALREAEPGLSLRRAVAYARDAGAAGPGAEAVRGG